MIAFAKSNRIVANPVPRKGLAFTVTKLHPASPTTVKWLCSFGSSEF